MTPAQRRTFDELLMIGAERPVADTTVVERCRTLLVDETAAVMPRWTEPSLWVTKSMLGVVHRCEGSAVAAVTGERRRLQPAMMAGQVTHRAVQMSHTHPGRPVDDYVRLAVAGCCNDRDFADAWEAVGEAAQSDCIVTAVSRTTAFLDSFPPLDSGWNPRFEDPMTVRVGTIALSARPDLVLGRPRADGRQTMLLCDLKSGDLTDDHLHEAHFYALVAALRHGVPPFRSLVFSLSSGMWTDPDVDGDVLIAAAQRTADGIRRHVELLTEQRPPTLTPGRHCRFCAAVDRCPDADLSGRVTTGGLSLQVAVSQGGDGSGVVANSVPASARSAGSPHGGAGAASTGSGSDSTVTKVSEEPSRDGRGITTSRTVEVDSSIPPDRRDQTAAADTDPYAFD